MNERCQICGDHTDGGNVCRHCLETVTIDLTHSDPLDEIALPEPEFEVSNRKARRARAAMRRKW